MKIASFIIGLLLSAVALAQVTYNVPSQTVTLPSQSLTTSSGQTVNYGSRSLTISAQTITVSPPTVVNPPPPPPPPPPPHPTGVTWMYLNGVKTLAGDFTGTGTAVNYSHSVTGAQLNGGTKDIQLTTSGAGVQWPYFLPYFAANYKLPNPGWTYLLISVKPTVTGQAFGLHMERVGDNPLPSVELLKYGPATVAGQWSSYTIPLKDLGTYGDATLYKFLLQDHSDNSSGFELDAIGFQ